MLAGDAISNYKTVASFAREDQIVKDYDRMLEDSCNAGMRMAHIIGLLFGFSQFAQYGIYALLYYFGAIFIKD